MTTISNKMTEKVNVTNGIIESFGQGLWAYIAIVYTAIAVQAIGGFYSPVETVTVEQPVIIEPVVIIESVVIPPGIPVPINTTFEKLPESLGFDFHGDFIVNLGTLLPEKIRHYGFCSHDLTYCNRCNYEMTGFIKDDWIEFYPTEDVPHYVIYPGLSNSFFRRLKDCEKPLPAILDYLNASIMHEDDLLLGLPW